MARDDIIRWAREVGYTSYDSQDERLQRLAALVAAHEREECAKVCQRIEKEAQSLWDMRGSQCAVAIRARGEA